MANTQTRLPSWTPPRWLNWIMKTALRTPGLQRQFGRTTALLSFTGRSTGHSFTTPVTYHRDGDTVTILTRRSRDWWRNFEVHPTVEIRLAGVCYLGVATIVTDDEAALDRVEWFLASHPADARMYGVAVDDAGHLDLGRIRELLPQLVVVSVALSITEPHDR